MRIVFMGTPAFAVQSLAQLIEAGNEIAAVVTVPDKPAGRGKEMQESAVKKFALQKKLHLLQPEKLRDENFIRELKKINADLFVVVAFRMLPEVVWSLPKYGSINLHASLLPDYRGAAPINHAIINGEHETGVSTFFLNGKIDTGEILFQRKVPIERTDTAGTLHDKLMLLGASVLVDTVHAIEIGDYKPVNQSSISGMKTAPKIFRDNCLIDFSKEAQEVCNFIRGLSPHPAAYTLLKGKVLKIYACTPGMDKLYEKPGMFLTDGKSFIHVSCAKGYISITELQLEGKKKMSTKEFLNGYSDLL